jgi:lambda repressor-like predicted transcriptional regulator
MEQNQTAMTPVDIKVKLLRANVTQAAIAREIGVSQVSVLRVIKNHSASHRIRLAVAKAIDRDVRQIWPDAGKKRGWPRTYFNNS